MKKGSDRVEVIRPGGGTTWMSRKAATSADAVRMKLRIKEQGDMPDLAPKSAGSDVKVNQKAKHANRSDSGN